MREEAERFHADWILCDASPLDYPLEEGHLETVVRSNPPIAIPFPFVREALLRADVSADDSPKHSAASSETSLRHCLKGRTRAGRRKRTGWGIPLTMASSPHRPEGAGTEDPRADPP